MSPKSSIEAPGSPLIYNASAGGSLRQAKPGEKRVGASRPTSGAAGAKDQSAAKVSELKRPQAKLVQDGRVIVVVYK